MVIKRLIQRQTHASQQSDSLPWRRDIRSLECRLDETVTLPAYTTCHPTSLNGGGVGCGEGGGGEGIFLRSPHNKPLILTKSSFCSNSKFRFSKISTGGFFKKNSLFKIKSLSISSRIKNNTWWSYFVIWDSKGGHNSISLRLWIFASWYQRVIFL